MKRDMAEKIKERIKTPPIGNASIMGKDGKYHQVAGVWFRKNPRGNYFALTCKEAFSLPVGGKMAIWLNSTSFRVALIDRRTFIV